MTWSFTEFLKTCDYVCHGDGVRLPKNSGWGKPKFELYSAFRRQIAGTSCFFCFVRICNKFYSFFWRTIRTTTWGTGVGPDTVYILCFFQCGVVVFRSILTRIYNFFAQNSFLDRPDRVKIHRCTYGCVWANHWTDAYPKLRPSCPTARKKWDQNIGSAFHATGKEVSK